jgi:hypothetical protein
MVRCGIAGRTGSLSHGFRVKADDAARPAGQQKQSLIVKK